jgi:hypothetical protein
MSLVASATPLFVVIQQIGSQSGVKQVANISAAAPTTHNKQNAQNLQLECARAYEGGLVRTACWYMRVMAWRHMLTYATSSHSVKSTQQGRFTNTRNTNSITMLLDGCAGSFELCCSGLM